jgi:hypothetical protein
VLDNNPIVYDKNFFSILTNIEYISLSNNKINNISIYSFSSLKYLETLILANNNISQINGTNMLPLTLKILDLSNNNLQNIPSLLNLNSLEFISFQNQNGKLSSLNNYTFERNSTMPSGVSIYLNSNNIAKFEAKSFCSRYSMIDAIQQIFIDSVSIQHLHRCTIRQLRLFSNYSFNITIEVSSASGQIDPIACNCTLINFLKPFKIFLTGICASVQCKNESIIDDCKNMTDYTCENSFLTTTPASSTITSNVTTYITTDMTKNITTKAIITSSKQSGSSFKRKQLNISALIFNFIVLVFVVN